jgi:hypothetical protein
VTSLRHLSDIDFSAAVVASQSTNPWMVLLLGSISGLLAFALSNALRVVIVRYPAQKARLRLDPNEFHEFVVGVGLVSRRISTGSATARPVPTSPTSVRSASSDSIGSGEASLSLLQDVAT